MLLEKINSNRDKAILTLFTESGMRLFELLNIRLKDIDWDSRIIRVPGKGSKEGYALYCIYVGGGDSQELSGTARVGLHPVFIRLADEDGT